MPSSSAHTVDPAALLCQERHLLGSRLSPSMASVRPQLPAVHRPPHGYAHRPGDERGCGGDSTAVREDSSQLPGDSLPAADIATIAGVVDHPLRRPPPHGRTATGGSRGHVVGVAAHRAHPRVHPGPVPGAAQGATLYLRGARRIFKPALVQSCRGSEAS